MQPITTDTSDFEDLRKRGLTYVDKTAYFHRLIADPSRKFYFIARPRRFGKSLGVTTLKSIFLGHREFFKGLAIDKTESASASTRRRATSSMRRPCRRDLPRSSRIFAHTLVCLRARLWNGRLARSMVFASPRALTRPA